MFGCDSMYLPSICACASSEYGWFTSSVEIRVYVATRSTPSRIVGFLVRAGRRPDRFGNFGSVIRLVAQNDGEPVDRLSPLTHITWNETNDDTDF